MHGDGYYSYQRPGGF